MREDFIKCDQCGTKVMLSGSKRLHKIPFHSLVFGTCTGENKSRMYSGNLDFCSLKCLSEYVNHIQAAQ